MPEIRMVSSWRRMTTGGANIIFPSTPSIKCKLFFILGHDISGFYCYPPAAKHNGAICHKNTALFILIPIPGSTRTHLGSRMPTLPCRCRWQNYCFHQRELLKGRHGQRRLQTGLYWRGAEMDGELCDIFNLHPQLVILRNEQRKLEKSVIYRPLCANRDVKLRIDLPTYFANILTAGRWFTLVSYRGCRSTFFRFSRNPH